MLENISKLSQNDKYVKKSHGGELDKYSMAMLENYSDQFFKLTDSIQLPSSFDPSKDDIEQFADVLCWLEDMATNVYVKSELVNHFFLLHGITGLYIYFFILFIFNHVIYHVPRSNLSICVFFIDNLQTLW